LHQISHIGISERMDLKLFDSEIICEEFQPTNHGTWSPRTNRRTNGRHAIS